MSRQRPTPSPLTIHPPSPDRLAPPPLVTPVNQISIPGGTPLPHSSSGGSGSIPQIASPSRRSTFSASPSSSVHSSFAHGPPIPGLPGYLGADGTGRTSSLDVPQVATGGNYAVSAGGVGAVRKQSHTGPTSPVDTLDPGLAAALRSPSRRDGIGKKHASAYDNKLVSQTLSHLPALPPLSPTPTGNASVPHPLPTSRDPLAQHTVTSLLSPQYTSNRNSFSGLSNSNAPAGRASLSVPASSTATSSSSSTSAPSTIPGGSGGKLLMPDGSLLPLDSANARPAGLGTRVMETITHSSANSPWSVLTVHALPLFAGSNLKTPIEDLNHLCQSHILATAQRAPPARLIAVLSSDFRDFIASGMLTLKAKFETVEEAKLVQRSSEVWNLFWARILPYLESVFLAFSQLRILPSISASYSYSSSSFIYTDISPIPVRQLLLSGFLIHIFLPIFPRLTPIISLQPNAVPVGTPPPTLLDLQRILQMSLVLATQAKYSAFVPIRDPSERTRQDALMRENAESLGKAVRWRMAMSSLPGTARPAASADLPPSLRSDDSRLRASAGHRRGPSASQNGRYRRQGWKASTLFGQQWGQPLEFDHPFALGAGGPHGAATGAATAAGAGASAYAGAGTAGADQWGRQRFNEDEGDDEEYDDDVTPNQSAAPSRYGSTASTATATASTAGRQQGIAGGLGTMEAVATAELGLGATVPMSTLSSTMSGLTVGTMSTLGTGTSGTITPGQSLIPSRGGMDDGGYRRPVGRQESLSGEAARR